MIVDMYFLAFTFSEKSFQGGNVKGIYGMGGRRMPLQQQRHIETVEKYMEKTMYLISLQFGNAIDS